MKSLYPLERIWRTSSTSRSLRRVSQPLQSRSYIKHVSLRHYSSARAPEAPARWISHPLKPTTTGVKSPVFPKSSKTTSKARTAYIALGSNLGDKIGWISKACNEMSARGIKVKRTSCLWETEPMYVLDQESFINGACEVETTLEPLALLDVLQSIENDLGRKKVIDKGPRNIDLDVLLYDDRVVDHERLKIPHAGMLEREFVLRPLSELIPSKPLYTARPWKGVQDYLNDLDIWKSSMSTVTSLGPGVEPLRALNRTRRTQIMAIFNLTPDSFSDGGHNPTQGLALTQILTSLASSSATIIDVGGQSSRPHAESISTDEEISRVVPAIQKLRALSPNITISIDTYRASVAEAAVNAGANIINDVSAGLLDPDMLPTMAKLGKAVCLMHMRGTPDTMNSLTSYPEGIIPGVATELLSRVQAAEEAGVRRWNIILDPGIGFAKTTEQNLELLGRLDELREWPGLKGLPWLVGSSRKKFVGRVTGADVPKDRIWGTAATVSAAVVGGADVVRVHDVEEMATVVKMSDAIWRV